MSDVFSRKDKEMFNSLLRTLTAEQRIEFIQSMAEVFCFDCGRLFTKAQPAPCHCENDE